MAPRLDTGTLARQRCSFGWLSTGRLRLVRMTRFRREADMASLIQFLLFVLVIVTGLSYTAGGLYPHGAGWAMLVCSEARLLCDHPDWPALTTGAVSILYFCVPRTQS